MFLSVCADEIQYITCIQRPLKEVMKMVTYSRWPLNAGSVRLI